MGCVVDHLRSDHRVEVIRDFTDARGARHHAGEVAILRKMDLDWGRQEIVFEWERDGANETLHFALNATDGPRNGRMRDYFLLQDYLPTPREKSGTVRRGRKVAVPVLPPKNRPVTATSDYAEAVSRIWALAAKGQYEDAEEQIRLILAPEDPFDARLEQLAGDMVGVATAHAEDQDNAMYDWARRWAINLWYAWGSGATSGGEGAVRSDRIRDAEAALARCDALRNTAPNQGTL